MQFTTKDPSEAQSVKTVIKCTPPSILYHYTKREGFLGILEERSIRASHIRYLNDAHEMAFAIHLTQQILEEHLAVVAADEQKKLCTELQKWLQSFEHQTQVFVFSISEDGDLLSQWRAYCKSSDGYAIGFDTQKLRQYANSQSFYMAPCMYDNEAQRALVSLLINDVNGEYQQKVQSGISVDEAITHSSAYFLLLFLILAPVLKDPAFKEEKEWRLISFMAKYGFGQQSVLYRDGRSLLIPYVNVELAPEGEQLPIAEVVIGPTPHMMIESTAVMGCLIRANASGRLSRFSKVPYRGV